MVKSAAVLSLLQAYWPFFLVGAVIVYLLRQRYQHGLNKVPGPVLRSFSTIPRLLSVNRGRSHEDDMALHRKYGSIVRLGPNLISVADPGAIETLYGIGTSFQKSAFYELSEGFDDEGLIPDPFILNDKALHTRMKRNASNAYAMNGLVQMEPWIEPVTDRLVEQLQRVADTTGIANLGDMLGLYTMDAVCALTFGRDFDYLSQGDVLGIQKMMKLMSWYMAVFGQIPWVHRLLMKSTLVAQLVLGTDPTADSAEALSLVNDALEEARQLTEKEDEMKAMTFLQRLIFNQRSNPASLTDREIFTHAWGNTTAGSDTTATAMRSVFYHLLKTPDVLEDLKQTLRDAHLSLPVAYQTANNIPLLRAVVREAMRLHPSVGMVLDRVVPQGGTEISGHVLAAGVRVGVNPWIVHRDPVVFAPDPDAFRPSRWLEGDQTISKAVMTPPDQLRAMNRAFLTFGHGAHTCSGRWISLMETVKLVPTLLLQFDLDLVDGGKDYRYDNFWFVMQEGLKVHVKRREVEKGQL